MMCFSLSSARFGSFTHTPKTKTRKKVVGNCHRKKEKNFRFSSLAWQPLKLHSVISIMAAVAEHLDLFYCRCITQLQSAILCAITLSQQLLSLFFLTRLVRWFFWQEWESQIKAVKKGRIRAMLNASRFYRAQRYSHNFNCSERKKRKKAKMKFDLKSGNAFVLSFFCSLSRKVTQLKQKVQREEREREKKGIFCFFSRDFFSLVQM